MLIGELDMYPLVRRFLEEDKGCERVLVDKVGFKKVKSWKIDVVGIRKSRVYAVEVKSGFGFDSVSGALMQAEFYKYACTGVYVCFPRDKYYGAKGQERDYLKEQCAEKGIGLLLVDVSGESGRDKNIEEVLGPRKSDCLDFDLYHQVVTQLTGEYDREFRMSLCKALGVLIMNRTIEDDLGRFKSYCGVLDREVAFETLIFDQFHWPLRETLRSPSARSEAERIYEEVKEEAFREGKSPVEYLADKDVYSYMVGKFKGRGQKAPKQYIQAINKIIEKVREYDCRMKLWYEREGTGGIYEYLLKGVRGLGGILRVGLLFHAVGSWAGISPKV
ncbi:MAG: hypothetical protein DRP09_18955 [Candidatus Thorarchaeota archaeon]|nr:MAG: hypothetical protein DRP09_18955 [Candidatus Thorarchaeota archaeon]